MNLLETKQHQLLRAKIREFAEQKIKPVILNYDAHEEFPVELVREMGKNDLFGIHIPQEYGGGGVDYLGYIIAVEELARVDSSTAATIAAHNSLGISPIYEHGTEVQRKKYLPNLCTGEKLWAFGLTEKNAGSDSQGVETTAILANKNWVINGGKTFITNGASELAAGITIEAITGEKNGKKELSAILLERDTPGFSRKPIKGKLVWRTIDNGELKFDNCKVPEENLLGERGQGPRIMLKTLDAGRLSIAAIGLGLSQGAYEMALSHARKRIQFGKPIIENQVISFKIAEMAMLIETVRCTLYHACKLKDNGQPFGKEAAMVKLYSAEVAKKVADDALQIHGAMGFLHENHIERFFRDQKLLQIGEGTSEILKMVISRHIQSDYKI